MRRLTLFLLALVCLYPATALAAKNAAVPAPPGFKVVAWRGHLSNLGSTMDFGFDADTGQPIWHTKVQDALHREKGWLELLGMGDFTGPDGILIIVTQNTYKAGGTFGSHWARAAAQDFRAATTALGFTRTQTDPLVPASASSGTIVQTADQGGQLNVAGAIWTGNTESEGIIEGPDTAVDGQPDPSAYQGMFTALLQQALAHQTARTIGPCAGCSG